MKNFLIVIPAYNEKENILKLIIKIRKITSAYIIIVDDTENELTYNIIKQFKFKNLKYFNRKKKLGRGSAVIFGFKKGLKLKKNFECFIEMDADMSHNPNELIRNLSYFKKKSLDMLIGSRYLKKSKIIGWSVTRKVLSKLANILAKFLLGEGVNDYTNGYRFYSPKAVKLIISTKNRFSSDFIILSEIIVLLNSKNYAIGEINTIFKNRVRGASSVNLNLVFKSLAGLIFLFVRKTFNKII